MKMPGFWPGVLFLGLLNGVLLAAGAWADACQPAKPLESAVVKSIGDGDTLQLADGRRLRLLGVNTPELRHGREPDQPQAAAAKRALAQLLPVGATVYLQPGAAPSDRHGRLLAHAFRSQRGDSVEAELLRRGFGFRVAIPPNLAYQDCFAAAEREARRAARGVWREPGLAPRPAATLTGAGFQRVRARVVAVEESADSWWLETDGPLVLRLDKADLRYFRDGWADHPKGWLGRTVTVRGWVVDRSRQALVRKRKMKPLMLRLQHISMLE